MTTIQTPPTTGQEFRAINKSIRRADAKEKILGLTRYAADFDLAGCLHARLVRAPLASARIVHRDASEAEALPGVVRVLFGEDVPNNEVNVNVPGQQVDVQALTAASVILATERIRYHGEPVALVIAESPDVLDEAAMLVEVDYEDLPVVSDPLEALQDDSPLVHESGNLLAEWRIDTGDVDKAFSEADIVVENEYNAQVVDHAYLEPEAGVGWLDDEGVINIRASTQVVEHYRDVAKILGLPDSKIRVQAPYLGGGFGGKEDMTVEPFIALGVYYTQRPVKMVWSRGESLTARSKRHPVIMKYRTAATKDGRLVAQDIEILSDAGAYPLLSAYVLLYITVNTTGPYKCDHVRVHSRAAYTNNTPGSAFRGFGGMQPVLGYEAQLDAIAKIAGLSRTEIRKLNAIEKGDRIPVGQELETAVWLNQCIDAAMERLGDRPEPSSPGLKVGLGLACNMQSFGRLVWLNDSSSSWVGYELDGGIIVRCGVPDVGGGQVSSLRQITAEVLHAAIDDVTVHFGDSARTPLAGTTTATRQLYMSGNATIKAAEKLKDQLLEGVSRSTDIPVDDLELTEGGVVTPTGVVALRQAIAMCVRLEVPINAMATFYAPRAPEAKGRLLNPTRIFPDATFGAHAAWVEVDPETGHVKPIRYVACHDVGRAINPISVEGQIAGAVGQGLGYALTERIIYRDSLNLTGGFFQYTIPTSADVPEIEVVILESGEGAGPFNARGIGEPPIGPCASVIASAVEDAIGERPRTLPILAEEVLACIDRASASVE